MPSLPKGGPVQTSYEEKLWLYSLYKQGESHLWLLHECQSGIATHEASAQISATEGDIAIPRPGLLDMLGRAKWDSWNKQKGKGQTTCKREYVQAMLNVSRALGRTVEHLQEFHFASIVLTLQPRFCVNTNTHPTPFNSSLSSNHSIHPRPLKTPRKVGADLESDQNQIPDPARDPVQAGHPTIHLKPHHLNLLPSLNPHHQTYTTTTLLIRICPYRTLRPISSPLLRSMRVTRVCCRSLQRQVLRRARVQEQDQDRKGWIRVTTL